jgi:hopene-associated glycosyltransferase HpnB
MTVAALVALLALAVWLYHALFRGGFWQADVRDDAVPPAPAQWPAVVAVVPARNEADVLPKSLASLLALDYPGPFRVVLVDDNSTDGTGDVARQVAEARGAAGRFEVIHGKALPEGWTGKLWALSQGVQVASVVAEPRSAPTATAGASPPEYLLLTDADIAFAPDALKASIARAEAGRFALVSLMARLNCQSAAERALIPAFVFFFQMLYPFRWVNNPSRSTAAAAGGFMLVRRSALEAAGGIAAVRGALIDDCALGARLKRVAPIWLGLTDRVTSLRPYPHFADIRAMVARSAYAELRYSPVLLIGCILGMVLVYLAPPLIAVLGPWPASAIAMVAWLLMTVCFTPILQFYRVSPLYALALPLIACAYLGFTIDSAVQHGRGQGGQWKGRGQALPPGKGSAAP